MNPKGRKMARHHHRKHHSAGRRRHHYSTNPRRNPARHHRTRRRHNPGRNFTIGEVVRGSLGAGVGFLGSKILTQSVLGAGNTGFMGYFGSAIATAVLSWGAHAFTKSQFDAFMVAIGGALNILGRIIADNSLLGQYSAQLGMGDYLVANWWVPQRVVDPFSLNEQQYDMSWLQPSLPAPVPIASAAPPGMGYLPAPIPSVYGNDLY
jgi:hypothetical protein